MENRNQPICDVLFLSISLTCSSRPARVRRVRTAPRCKNITLPVTNRIVFSVTSGLNSLLSSAMVGSSVYNHICPPLNTSVETRNRQYGLRIRPPDQSQEAMSHRETTVKIEQAERNTKLAWAAKQTPKATSTHKRRTE